MSLLPQGSISLPDLAVGRDDPVAVLRASTLAVGQALAVEFELRAYWLEHSPSVALIALYLQTSAGLQLAVTDRQLTVTEASAPAQFAAWAEQGNCAIVDIGSALPLAPVYIPKPWGQEIWFSGIERRGLSGVSSATGVTPIPWLQPESREGCRPSTRWEFRLTTETVEG